MYLNYWHFKEKPFENAIDPRFIYYSPQHKEALMRLFYTVSANKGIGVLTGELGSGKTLLTKVLFNKLNQQAVYKIASIINPVLSFYGLIKEVILQAGGEIPEQIEKEEYFRLLEEVTTNLKERGQRLVIIIDEAQLIQDNHTFGQLRLLYNYQKDKEFLITLILVGQPELKEKIKQNPAFAQRVNLSYHLRELNSSEVEGYIRHRCRVAGGGCPFNQKSIQEIFVISGGIPRKINLICELALLQAFHLRLQGINQEIIKNVSEALEYV